MAGKFDDRRTRSGAEGVAQVDNDDETATRDGAPIATGYKVSPSVTAVSQKPRYRRGPEIARGGLGRITEAYDETLQRQVAIKELHHRTEQGRRRFALESLTTARLQHPAIVGVFDSGTWDSGEPFLVLQLLEGTTLTEEIAKRPTLDARLALIPNLLAIADALGYAHEQGVVHRDVKPSNIMLGKHGETVILDWGVAFDNARPLPDSDELLVGTPRFMSPEQARGEAPVPAFDVFSLGVTIATLLAGKQPFADRDADTIVETLRGGVTDVPSLPEGVPSDLASIVAKATSGGSRYAHAAELAGDLRRFIAGQLVGARRYTKRELFVRWLRRNRVLVAAAAVVIGVGVIAVGSVITQRNAAIAERERAVARSHELMLLEAKSRLRTDPTATIAWLKEYPTTAPHYDSLLALVDEAAGRMVAKHVWFPTSDVADSTFANDGALIVATHDGAITRIDPVSGARTTLAKLAGVPHTIRVHGARTLVLDEEGTLWRVEREPVRVTTVEDRGTIRGLFMLPDGTAKVAFDSGDVAWIGGETLAYGDQAYVDNDSDSRMVYAITDTGELVAGEKTLEKKWQFPQETWLRSSDDGTHYVAIAPATDGSVTVWVGTASAPPVQIGTSRACAAAEEATRWGGITNDGKVATLVRCGVLTVYETRAGRTIPVPDPERVTNTILSRDGRWLAVSHADGIDLIELSTGVSRRIDPGSAFKLLAFSPDGRSLYAAGIEPSVRIWQLPADAPTSRVGDSLRSQINLSLAGDDVLIRRHLDCTVWSTKERRIRARMNVSFGEARSTEDDRLMWPQSSTPDGSLCLFGGRNGTVIAIGVDGTKHTITKPSELCTLGTDGALASCMNGQELFTVEVATDRVVSSRTELRPIQGVVRVKGTPTLLVADKSGCTLQSFAGEPLHEFPGAEPCNMPYSVYDTTVYFTRGNNTVLWRDGRVFEVAEDQGYVYPMPTSDRAAVVRSNRIELVDLRTKAHLPSPPPHDRAVGLAVWSSDEVLASSDDEVIQIWDPATQRRRTIVAPHVTSMVWSRDGRTLHASDGRVMYAWPVDLAANTVNVRARLDELSTTRIVDGRATTP